MSSPTQSATTPTSNVSNTGLTIGELGILTVISTALFVVYPTLLWTADAHTSHVARFVVSYFAVIPIAALFLAVRRGRIRIGDLTAAVLIVWGIKMLITVGLYHGMAKQARPKLEPAIAVTPTANSGERGYKPVEGFTGRSIDGKILNADGAPMAGVVVYLDGVGSGTATSATKDVAVVFENGQYSPTLSAAGVGGHISISNRSNSPVVVTGSIDGHSLFNVPIVAGKSRRIRLSKVGLLHINSRTGSAVSPAWVRVLEHPYFTVTGPDGSFAFTNAPFDGVNVASISLNTDGTANMARHEVGDGRTAATVSGVVETLRDAGP